MTALILSAEARLSASTMISSSIRFSLVGAQVDCTTNTSRARTLVLISTVTSPSENRPTLAAPSEMPRWPAISAARPGLALPVNTMKSGCGRACIEGTQRSVEMDGVEHCFVNHGRPCGRCHGSGDDPKSLAGEEGLEPSHAGIKIRCLNQLGDSPTRVVRCDQRPTE